MEHESHGKGHWVASTPGHWFFCFGVMFAISAVLCALYDTCSNALISLTASTLLFFIALLLTYRFRRRIITADDGKDADPDKAAK
jgi:hypothetical protein